MAEGKPFLLNLDGRYYTASQAIQIYPDILAVVVPETSASNCRRPNGEAVTPGGQVLYYGPQVTQLFIGAHFIDRLEVFQGDDLLFRVEGGISISENPVFRFHYTDNGAAGFRVIAHDTEGNTFEETLAKDAAS